MLARELLVKPDNFITATLNNKEYIIESIQRVPTHVDCDSIDTH